VFLGNLLGRKEGSGEGSTVDSKVGEEEVGGAVMKGRLGTLGLLVGF